MHVTVVAASGDIGAVGEPCQVIKGLIGGTFSPVKEVNLPASDPLVLAVGGTTLIASHTTGSYMSETACGLPFREPGSHFQASGGGLGHVFSRPAYQISLPLIGGYLPAYGAGIQIHVEHLADYISGRELRTSRPAGTSSSQPTKGWASSSPLMQTNTLG